MSLRYALLALLVEGEAHGYQLLKRFTAQLGPFWHPNIGQVYQLLRDLERRRLIARRDEARGTRTRHRYHLTARGERALRAWLARRPGWPPPLREEIFVRFLAARRDGADALIAQVDRQEEEYRRYLAVIQEEGDRTATSVTRRLAHEAVLGHVEARLRWLAHCRVVLGDAGAVPAVRSRG